jgi:hypothetical protein
VELVEQHQGNDQTELIEKISRDPYMLHAVEEVYKSLVEILNALLKGEDREWFVYTNL